MEDKGKEFVIPQWSHPLTLKKWCLVYGYEYPRSRNKMSRMFRDQVYRNKRISSQEYCVHIEDLPAPYVLRILFAKSTEDLERALKGGFENLNIIQNGPIR